MLAGFLLPTPVPRRPRAVVSLLRVGRPPSRAAAMAAAITLSSGCRLPVLGLGVWGMEKESIRDLLLSAIKIGYHHFDCTADYLNEAEVADALAEAFQTGLVKREDLFITAKLWNSDHGHVVEALVISLIQAIFLGSPPRLSEPGS